MSYEVERELVLDAVGDAFNDFVFYSRKNDQNLPGRKLAQLVRDGIVTKTEIAARWAELIEAWDPSAGWQ